jgi:chromosome segregation ATPase
MTSERLNEEITEAMKALFDLTGRIDERVKILFENNDKVFTLINRLEEKTHVAAENYAKISEKVAAVEAKFTDLRSDLLIMKNEIKADMKSEVDSIVSDLSDMTDNTYDSEKRLTLLEKTDDNQENRWKVIIGYVLQTCWVLLVCYLLYKLNLQTPPIP